MSTATARVASEGVDYLAVIKGYFKKNKSNGRPKDSNLVVVKILGLEFRHQWGSQLRAEYKTALGKIEPFTIYNLESDSLKLDGFVDNSEVNDSASIVRFVKEEIAALEAKVAANARVIAKRHTLKFGEVVIPIRPVTGDYITGPKIVTEDTKKAMKKVLSDIQDGTFAKDFLLDMSDAGSQVHFKAMRKLHAEHPSEKVGKEIRKLYSWNNDDEKLINN
jgi:hypothetical protein